MRNLFCIVVILYLVLSANSQNVGIGNSSPNSLLSVGNNNQLQVNSTGNLIMLNNVIYSWPSAQGIANSFLQNDGSGNLVWAPPSSGIKQVIRGNCIIPQNESTASQTFSPAVVTSKCIIEASVILSGSTGSTGLGSDVIVTNLTTTTISFKVDNTLTYQRTVGYQIIEYY